MRNYTFKLLNLSGSLNMMAGWNFLKLSLVVAAFTIVSSNAILFELAPHSRDCFYVKINAADSEIVGSYQTFFGDGSCRITIEGPVTPQRNRPAAPMTPIYIATEETGQFKTRIAAYGDYSICVRNLLTFDQTVTMDFHVAHAKAAFNPNQLVLEDETQRLKHITDEVVEKADQLFEQQSHSMVRQGVHEQLAFSTRNRATLWKCIQMGIQLFLTGVHMYSIKSYFEVKTIV